MLKVKMLYQKQSLERLFTCKSTASDVRYRTKEAVSTSNEPNDIMHLGFSGIGSPTIVEVAFALGLHGWSVPYIWPCS